MTDPSTVNPLLASTHVLPDFEAIRPEHVEPAVREVLAAQRRALGVAETVAAPTLDWLRNLERINTEINRVWGPVSHLNSVLSSPPLRDAYNRCLPLVTEFSTELGQNEALYRHFGTLKERVTPAQPVERHLVTNALRDFRHGSASASSCNSSPRARPRSSRTSWTPPTRSSTTRQIAASLRACRSSRSS